MRWMPPFLVSLAVLLLVANEALAAPVKYFLSKAGLTLISYLPAACALLAMAATYLCRTILRRVPAIMLGLAAIAVLEAAVAVAHRFSVYQVAAGVYVWIPFVMGMLLYVEGGEELLYKCMVPVWAVSTAGILLNAVTSFPWEGSAYDVMGIQIPVSREWSIMGFERLAGFTRSSFMVANLVLISCCYILAKREISLAARIGCYLLSGLAIFFTTSKTPLALWALLPFLWLGPKAVAGLWSGASPLAERRSQQSIIAIFAAVVVLLPYASGLAGYFNLGSGGFFFSWDTLVLRFQDTWPNAFGLLHVHGNTLFGRGLGGIGSPQIIAEPFYFDPGDNLFVYAFITTGLVGTVPLFYGVVAGAARRWFETAAYDLDYMLLLAVLGIGLTLSVIEGTGLGAIVLGAMVAKGYATSPVEGELHLGARAD